MRYKQLKQSLLDISAYAEPSIARLAANALGCSLPIIPKQPPESQTARLWRISSSRIPQFRYRRTRVMKARFEALVDLLRILATKDVRYTEVLLALGGKPAVSKSSISLLGGSGDRPDPVFEEPEPEYSASLLG